MKRNFTNKINYILDNWVPPLVRDSKTIMSILFRIVLGKKYHYYMDFKDNVPHMTEKDINKYYSILADTFLDRDTDLSDSSIAFILKHLKGNKILDAAAGKGYLAKLIKEKGVYKITALDIVLPDRCEEGIEYVKGSLTNLPFEDSSFDTVICTHALEHIKDVELAMEELKRVCRGHLIIVVPRQREYKYTFDLHINFYPYRYQVEKLLTGIKADIHMLDNDWVCMGYIE